MTHSATSHSTPHSPILFAMGAAALLAATAHGQSLVAMGATVMGGVQGKRFVELDDLPGWEAKAKGAWTVHAPGQSPRKVASATLEQDEVHCGNGGHVALTYAAFPAGVSPEVAIQGSWNPFPRLPKAQGTQNPTYRKVVEDVLAKQGLAKVPANIVLLDRIDLDGDGTEEVVLLAQDAGPATKDEKLSYFYSIVVVRRVEDGKVVDHVLRGNGMAGSTAGRNVDWAGRMDQTLEGYADLDGDGSLEILVSEHGVDYGGDSIWKMGPKGPVLVAHQSCGA